MSLCCVSMLSCDYLFITQEAAKKCGQVYVISTVLHCSEMPRVKSCGKSCSDEDEGNNIIK